MTNYDTFLDGIFQREDIRLSMRSLLGPIGSLFMAGPQSDTKLQTEALAEFLVEKLVELKNIYENCSHQITPEEVSLAISQKVISTITHRLTETLLNDLVPSVSKQIAISVATKLNNNSSKQFFNTEEID